MRRNTLRCSAPTRTECGEQGKPARDTCPTVGIIALPLAQGDLVVDRPMVCIRQCVDLNTACSHGIDIDLADPDGATSVQRPDDGVDT